MDKQQFLIFYRYYSTILSIKGPIPTARNESINSSAQTQLTGHFLDTVRHYTTLCGTWEILHRYGRSCRFFMVE